MTAKTAYDVIFMDHVMPDMDGQQTLENIRNQEKRILPAYSGCRTHGKCDVGCGGKIPQDGIFRLSGKTD